MMHFDSVPVPASWTKIVTEPTKAELTEAELARKRMLDRMGLTKRQHRSPHAARDAMIQRQQRRH